MLQNYNLLKVARVFFDEPTKEHYLKEISKKAKLAHTSVKNQLDKLIKEKIIKKINKKYGNRTYPLYLADIDSDKYKFYKKIDNLLRLEETNAVNRIWEETQPRVIILFGSYAEGEDIEESDIDIFTESEVYPDDMIEYGKIKGLSRNINIYSKNNFENVPIRLKRNIINGIVLRGYIRYDTEDKETSKLRIMDIKNN
jgi:predicted nucleotidyltransferase